MKKNSKKNSLFTEEEFQTPFVESKLKDIYKIFKDRNYENQRMISFLKDESIYDELMIVSPYLNNILQYSMKTFFSKKGFETIDEFSIKNGEMITFPPKQKIQCDIDKTFDAYKNAYIFLKNKKTKDGMIIYIDDDEFDNSIYIHLYFCNPHLENLTEEWKTFSKKNNFYKGKKIDVTCNFLKLDNTITWDDVILTPKVRETIRRSVENTLRLKDILVKNKISTKRGILICGPPGCVIKGTKIKIRKKKEEGKHIIIDNSIV